MLKGKEYAFRSEVSVSKLFILSSKKGSTLKGKNLFPVASKLFPFRVDLFFRMGDWCLGKQTLSQELSPL